MTYPRDAKETSVDKRMKKREDNPFLVWCGIQKANAIFWIHSI
jgi:hypothetical protein